MEQTREHENKVTQQRIERTYHINNLWYFELRGGGQQGPFDSEEAMHAALEEFIHLHEEIKQTGK